MSDTTADTVRHSVEDPTAKIVSASDNSADPTRLSPMSLGEVKTGRSALDAADASEEPAPEELSYEEMRADWLANPLPAPSIELVTGPSGLLLVAAGLSLFGLGLLVGSVAVSVLAYLN